MSQRFRVLLADKIPPTGLGPLHDDHFELVEATGLDGDDLREALAGVDGVIIRSTTTLDRAALEGNTRLRVIGRAGVGVDNIDVAAATEQGIAVFNAPSGNTISAAELTMALILGIMRKVAAADRSMRSGEWDRKRFRGSELNGKTLALIGAGRIGGEVARRARAFGMKVVAHDPFLREERASRLGIVTVSLREALQQGDVVSLHVPLTDNTTGMIGAEEIALMKPTAVLVNAARGGVLKETALVEALEAGTIAGAALDTYTTEPLPGDHPLRQVEQVLLTPHIGAATVEAQHNVAYEVAAAVRNALLDSDFGGALNAPAVGSELVRKLQPLTDLATRLGRLARTIAGSLEAVEIRYAGEHDEAALRPLTAASLVGILQDIVGPDSVNLVNAMHLAESRGLHLRRVLLESEPEHGEYVELRIAGGGRETRVAGTLRGSHPRIVRVDEFPMDVHPGGVLLLLRNRDVPGVIGHVGSLLGGADVNIAEYHQSRLEAGGDALAAIAVDDRLDPDLIQRLGELDDVLDVRQVDLG